MKLFYLKKLRGRWLLLCSLSIITILIIHSCKKDNKSINPDQAVADAKSWYESSYPILSSGLGGRKLSLARTPGGSAPNTSGIDFSQMINPDWNHNAVYKRFNKNVVEMPVDPSSATYFGLRTEKKAFNPVYTRTSFLILKDSSSYAAYVMVVVADSSYVNGDLTKLAHNTYRKHDADFSGLVMYFTPKGKFLSSWGYKNGQLLAPAGVGHSSTANTQLSTGAHLSKSLSTSSGGKVLADEAPFTVVCEDIYVDAFINGVFNGTYYAYTICSATSGGGPSGGSGGDGGSGDAGSSGGSSVGTIIDCPNAATNMVVVHPSGRVLANTAPIGTAPPPDGGFPDPTSPPTPSCLISAVDSSATPYIIINNLTDPCLHAVANKLINNNLTGKIADIINNVFGSSDKINIIFQENDNTTPTQTTPPVINNGIYNETITINFAQVNGSSQEYKMIIMVHEILHAYMMYNGGANQTQLQQHQQMAQNYVGSIKTFVQSLYPTLSDADAYSVILNGMADVYNNNATAYQSLLQSYNTSQVEYEMEKDGLSGTPCSN